MVETLLAAESESSGAGCYATRRALDHRRDNPQRRAVQVSKRLREEHATLST